MIKENQAFTCQNMMRAQTVAFFKKFHQFSFSLDGATRETNANCASTNN
jgi:hypothetical protein